MPSILFWISLLLALTQSTLSRSLGISHHEAVRRATPTNTACAEASSAWESAVSADPESPKVHIQAQVAYDCLQSVPNKPGPALDVLDSISSWLEFQSDIDSLANPPEGRLFPEYDIFAELEAIISRVKSGHYASEYDFQYAVWRLARSAHDAHLDLKLDLLSVFTFARPDHELVLVSADGLELPRIYVKSDLVKADNDKGVWGPLTHGTMSPVQTINGVPVVQALLNATSLGPHQDPDANWNQLLSALEVVTPYYNSLVTYPGATTDLLFVNGTTATYNTSAIVQVPFVNMTIETGEDMYQAFCVPPDPTVPEEAAAATEASTPPPPEMDDPESESPTFGYPYPNARDPTGKVAGYFLNDTGFEDVAVLRVAGFLPPDLGPSRRGFARRFQGAIQEFLAACVEQGKRKLILDLQNNEGGLVLLSADLFAQLFPGLSSAAKTNRRASLGWELISKGVGQDILDLESAGEDVSGSITMNLREIANSFGDSAWPLAVDVDGNHFKNWEAYYRPIEQHGENFTEFFQSDLADELQTSFPEEDSGLIVSGTGNRTNTPASPFRPEDTIVLSNGICGSACTIFAERLKNSAGVQSVAIGGRPHTGPMQTVGSTKGSAVTTISTALQLYLPYLHLALENMTSEEYDIRVKGTKWENFTESLAPLRFAGGAFNTHNQFRVGDETETPLHYVYEAADCRIWPTWEMLYDPVFLWNRVATIAFKERDGKHFASPWCVAGSTGHPTSIGGGWEKGTLGPQRPPASAAHSSVGWELAGKALDGRVNYRADGPEAREFRHACDGYDGDDWLFKAMCGAVKA